MNTNFLLISFLIILLYACSKPKLTVDILIQNGTVYDGVAGQPMDIDVGIKENKIIFIGQSDSFVISANRVIDAEGMIVSPGFIDPHTHADRELKESDQSHNLPFLFQGVTSVVVGNDGASFFPTSKYKTLYETQGIGTNAILLLGHGTIREQVMGKSDRKASAAEIEAMQVLVQQEMDAGAIGMSTGLFYSPGSYSDTKEVIALSKIVAQNGGIYDTHLRDESSYTIGLIEAIKEAIEIGRQAQLPIHISHIKCLGVDVWHQSEEVVKLIENAQKEGIKVTADQYPYDASATGLKAAVVPRWAESGGKDSLLIRYEQASFRERILEETQKNIARRGGPDKLLLVKVEEPKFVGKNLLEIAKMLKTSPEQAVYEALKTGYVRVASFNMHPDDIHNFMQQDWVVTGSDGNTGHPRKYGSFPRKYRKYVKEERLISLSRFINNSSSKTAEILNLKNRGQIKEGYYADIIIFNPATFSDKADYTDAFQFAEGLKYSIVNGKLAVEDGEYTGQLNGRVLTKE